MKTDISLIIPVYKSEQSILPIVDKIQEVLRGKNFEIVLVDDRSPGQDWQMLEKVHKSFPNIKCVRLSRNFGQHAAIAAGLSHAGGSVAVILDCDLQHDPNYIPEMLKLSNEGHDIVYTVSENRNHSFLKNVLSIVFHKIFNFLADSPDIESNKRIGNFTLINRKVIDSYLKLSDQKRHHLLLLRWLGFTFCYLPIEHKTRQFGKSSYSLRKLLVHAVDGITAHSKKLLYSSIVSGFLFLIMSVVLSSFILYQFLTTGTLVGWASQMIAILFSFGITLTTLGVHGIYIGNIYDETRKRPLYVVDQVLNQQNETT